MVQLPSTNSVRESRHVAIYGLPQKIADGTLHNFFSKFGAIQDLSRQEGNQDIIYISFMDVRSAARACTTERFDRDTPCRITYCNPDDRPKNSLNGVPVAIDYCSDKLDSYLTRKDYSHRSETPKAHSSSKKTKNAEMHQKQVLRRPEARPSGSQSHQSQVDRNNEPMSTASCDDDSDDETSFLYRNGANDKSPIDPNFESRTPTSPFGLSPYPCRSHDPPEAPEEVFADCSSSAPGGSAEKHNDPSTAHNETACPSGSSSAVLKNPEPPDTYNQLVAPIRKKEKKRKKNGGKEDIKAEPDLSPRSAPVDLSDTELTRMMDKMIWKGFDISPYPRRIDDVMTRCLKTRELYEKLTGRPFPKFNRENDLKMPNHLLYESTEHSTDVPHSELEIRWREWNRYSDTQIDEFDEFRTPDTRELLRNAEITASPSTSRGSGRPSLDETRSTRLSLDLAHHPHELAQRSQSLCIGPMTPITPYHPAQPLLVNTSHTPGPSQPGPSGVMTPRNSQLQPQASPVSRHGSVSSSGKPASVQGLRHQSVMFPPDLSIPPPPVPPTHDEMMSAPPSRRSSETLAPMPLRSPPFTKQIPQLLSMPLFPPSALSGTPTGTHSVASSTTSTPRHSVSGGPVHHEISTPKGQQPQTPKTIRPEKVQARHDSISKPGPSSAASALQARSQSVSVADPKKNAPSTPVVRDAGSDLIDQIMSNQPSMGFKKLPKIEKKPSALLHSAQNQHNAPPAVSMPSTSNASVSTTQAALLKDKEKERRKKEREAEREREARKEMKKKETKEERHKRKEMERAKREEDERRERKREKQKLKEKEERRKEKEKEREREKDKERRRAEKEKLKRKKHRKDDDSDETDSSSGDDFDLDTRKSNKEMTQEEKDHQLALTLSEGSIYENLKSRRRTDKRGHESFEKLRQKNQNLVPRRVLIESSEDDDDDGDEEKGKSGESSDAGSDTEQRFLPPPPMAPTVSTQLVKPPKQKVHKEREKGELSSSSEEEEPVREKGYQKSREKEERENRKRQKSMSTYSSDDHNERSKKSAKRKKRDDSEERKRQKAWEIKEQQKQRKRKLERRRSSDDESKRKAKRDFRDVPLEDVSDEEEVEEASRARRPSTSSVASTAIEKKSLKTPLRVSPPSNTPLQSPKIISPKILSPKIISPKTSLSSTKRPSISDQESLSSLTSPKPRNRTTSSTSTATTISRHEASAPEKIPSPTVTAKSSISSVDELAIREELSATSAAASPMSVTGRPMVLTKAAMKAFHSSPPKKLRKPSRQHETSSPSSSSSDGSSSSQESSDDSSDATLQQPGSEKTPEIPIVPVISLNRVEKLNPVALVIPPPPVPPLIPPPPPPPVLDVPINVNIEESPVQQMPPHSSVSPRMETLPQEKASVPEPEPREQSSPYVSAEIIVREKANEELVSKEQIDSTPATLGSVDTDETAGMVPETTTRIFEETSVPVEKTCIPSRNPEVAEHETAPKSTQPQSLISDQETDQAVQSIFNEEDDEDFPQYPDFVLPKEQKDESDKETRLDFDDYTHPSDSNRTVVEPRELENAIASIVEPNDLLILENHNNHSSDLLQPSSSFNEEKRLELLRSMKGPESCMAFEDSGNEVVETDREVPMEEMDTQEVLENIGSVKKRRDDESLDKGPKSSAKLVPHHARMSSPEQTPTPDLIPNEVVREVEPTPMSPSCIHQAASRRRSSDVQIRHASPRRTFGSASSGQPVPVVQQPRSDNYSTGGRSIESRFDGQNRNDDVESARQQDLVPKNLDASTPNEMKNQITADRIQSSSLNRTLLNEPGLSKSEMIIALQRSAAEMALLQRNHAQIIAQHGNIYDEEQQRFDELQENDNRIDLSEQQRRANEERKKVNIMQYMSQDAQHFFDLLNITNRPEALNIRQAVAQAAKVPFPASAIANTEIAVAFQKWFYKTSMMSADEPTPAIATTPAATTASSADLATMLQHIQAMQAVQAAQQAQHVPVVTAASTPNPLANLETLLGSASFANLAAGAPLNPISMLALTSQLNQSGPVYQGIIRALLTMNMGQILAAQQTSELLVSMNQDPLMALLAARGGMPFQLPGQQQQQLQQQGVFAVPQIPQIPHMSLKRNNKDQPSAGGSDRKKSCPPLAMISGGHQGQPPTQQVAAPPPVAPQSPSPPPKSMFENLTPEMKEKNEMFRKEILRRLDIILLEELGTEDEGDDKKPEPKQIPTSDEDDTEDVKTESMGAAGSAFRRILSRSSTMGNNSGSPSASGTTSPSTGSLSSGPDSPPLERDPLSAEFVEMLIAVAQKHKKSSKFDGSALTTLDETSFRQNFPLMWSGRLALKSMETTINLHLLTGSENFLKDALGNPETEETPQRELVRITQRLRMDNGQLEHIHHILTNPDFACCIGLTSAADVDGLTAGDSSLQSSFIDYLNKKQIAGISCLENIDALTTARVHVFAPGPLVTQYLSELNPVLFNYICGTNIRYLFIVFTNDKSEPNMPPPSTPAEQSVVPSSSN